jgi:hypothetical protein
MKYLVKIISALGLATTLAGCNSTLENNALAISDASSTVSVSHYNVQFGSSTDKAIQDGLKLIISELLEISKKKENLKGSVTYVFRCESDGLIRWMAAGDSDLFVDKEDELINEFTAHLIKTKVKFPELGKVTMIEATFKFE